MSIFEDSHTVQENKYVTQGRAIIAAFCCQCLRFYEDGTMYEMGRCWRCGKHYTYTDWPIPISELDERWQAMRRRQAPVLRILMRIPERVGVLLSPPVLPPLSTWALDVWKQRPHYNL